MAANRMNYIVWYDGESQIYGSGSKEIALETPPPEGLTLESKHISFITHRPDDNTLAVHEIPREEILGAELKHKQTKKKKVEDEQA